MEIDPDLLSQDANEICKDCLFWKQFKEKCYVYWYKKKYCTMRVVDSGEFEEAKNMYKVEMPKKRTEEPKEEKKQ